MKYEQPAQKYGQPTHEAMPYSPAQMQELKTCLQHAVKRGRLGQDVIQNQSYEGLLYAAQARLSALKRSHANGVQNSLPEYRDWQAIVDIAKTYGEDVSYSSTYDRVGEVIKKITASIKPDLLSASVNAELNRTKRAQCEDCTGE